MEVQSTIKPSRSTNPDHIIIDGKSGHGIFMEFVAQDIIGQKAKNNDTPASKEWLYHGSDNLLPQNMLKLTWDNELKPELLMTQAGFMAGRGIRTFYEDVTDGKSQMLIQDFPEIDSWQGNRRKTRKFLRKYSSTAAINLSFFNNVYSEFILDDKRKKVLSIKTIDSTISRMSVEESDGFPSDFFFCGDWKNPKYDLKNPAGSNVKMVPGYDPNDPTKHQKFVLHTKIATPGNPRYGIPMYYGTRNWTLLSNKIPIWHSNGLDNGYNVRWHIEIPESYFDKFKTDKEKAQAKTDLADSLDAFLSGVENVGKGIISFFKTDSMGKEYAGWKITPLKTEMNDENFGKTVWEQASQSQSAGHGINPALAGIQLAGKLSSGSELREAYNIYMGLKTVAPREVLLEPIELLHELNGWPDDAEWWFENIELTKLDQNPTGTQTVA